MAECYGSMLQEQADRNNDEAQRGSEAYDAAIERVTRDLQRELIEAVENGQQAALIRTPGSHKKRLEAWEVFSDWLGTDDKNVKRLLSLLTLCCGSADPAIRIPGQALVATMATEHAEYHAGDLLAAMEGEPVLRRAA